MQSHRVFVLLAAVLAFAVCAQAVGGCYVKNPAYEPLVTGPLPRPLTASEMGDVDIDWRTGNDGRALGVPIVNQHAPTQYCGSCWAEAAVTALAHRMRITTNGAFPEQKLSVQYVLNCLPNPADLGCHGGDSGDVFAWLASEAEKGIVDFSCLPYEARSDYKCTPINQCRNCAPGKACNAVPEGQFNRFKVAQHGIITTGPTDMLAELSARGPLVAYMAVTDDFLEYEGGIWNKKGESTATNHAVTIVGAGSEKGQDFWLVQNSWGSFWGEGGYFRIARGNNQNGIELESLWVVAA